jgi:dihydroorotase
MDLTIEGKLFSNGKLENCCIGIKDGKISKIKKILKSDDHKNFGNNLILPAGIDMHVHFRDPGMTYKEDFSTGSKAAAFGGVTCFFDMPNTIPLTTTKQNLFKKIRIGEKKSFVDFGLYSGLTNNNLDKISEMEKYCNGFKLYMAESTNSMNFSKNNLKLLKNIDFNNKPILIHAEDQECFNNRFKEKNLIDHNKSRSSICETKAIDNIISIFRDSDLRIHVCHISSSNRIDEIRNCHNITCGITPHHLFLNVESKEKNQSLYKVNPPVRENFEREILFKYVQENKIDVIESDHAPHTLDEKNVNFDEAPSGIPGVETMIPIFLFLVKKGIISVSQFLKLFCEKPSEILDIPKGKIEVGRDADFIIVDLKKSTKINSDNLHYKCGWTPFENFQAIFPKHVFLRGEHLICDGELITDKSFGKFIGG